MGQSFMNYHLIVRNGPQKGRAMAVGDSPIIIGRDTACELSLRDRLVSRRHCEIALEGEHLSVTDLNSSNCTLVNGRPVTTCRLRVGDELSIGTTSILVTRHSESMGPSLPEVQSHTLYVGQSPAGEAVQISDGLPRNVHDLAGLVAQLREFSLAETTGELLHRLEKAIRERLTPEHLWISLVHGDTIEHVSQPGRDGAEIEPPNTLLYASIKENKHHLTTRQIQCLEDARYTVLVAPIGLAAECLGAVTVERPCEGQLYDDDDLNYLVGLARGAAPIFRTLERTRQLESDVVRFQSARRESLQFIGASESAQKLLYLIRIVARSDQPILVIGETGTGKELVAALIHELSDRARGPFVAVNCAAIPQELFESEVFGHEKGAFTGASGQHTGLLEESDGGTLFLDEVGDLHPSHQARLLRTVETGTYRRVGGEKDLHADFRVVAATNKNLEKAVETGAFREDLFHRLKGLQLNVPPLRDRAEDIPLLVDHFLDGALRRAKRPIHGLTDGALSLLAHLPWPGNIRELKHCVETAVALAPDAYIDEPLIQLILGEKQGAPRLKTLAEVERDHIQHILRACGGKVVEASKILGIGRSTLYDKLNQYEAEETE